MSGFDEVGVMAVTGTRSRGSRLPTFTTIGGNWKGVEEGRG